MVGAVFLGGIVLILWGFFLRKKQYEGKGKTALTEWLLWFFVSYSIFLYTKIKKILIMVI